MKLTDYKDANSTSIQSYAETLADKCEEVGITPVLIFVDKRPEVRGIHVISSVDAAALPTALIRLAQELREPARSSVVLPTTNPS
jgi:hypothetical protein